MRVVPVDGQPVDAGPTVLTMRHVFDQLFAQAGLALDDFATLIPLEVLARHAWTDGSSLDLFSSTDRNAEAIAALAGRRNADGYRRFLDHARKIHQAVEGPFIRAARASMISAAWRAGPRAALRLLDVDWQRTMWAALRSFFDDPRLLQLFGRYATYYGSSPFEAPATLSLIAHVEQSGVWRVRGGMHRLAVALAHAVREREGTIVVGRTVERIVVERGCARGVVLDGGDRVDADAVVVNADPNALAAGRFGEEATRAVKGPTKQPRSLSAMTFCLRARTSGLPLQWHNVFFGPKYQQEFDDVFVRRAMPREPTVYVCAADPEPAPPSPGEPRRLFALVNAPATGEEHDFTPEIEPCLQAALTTLERCGVALETSASELLNSEMTATTTPNDFERMFPATGGGLYGAATHGALAPFSRPGARTRIRSLYLVGGAVHPGAGVPMVALGGQAAAWHVLQDHPSMRRSVPMATRGGTSTRSATTERAR